MSTATLPTATDLLALGEVRITGHLTMSLVVWSNTDTLLEERRLLEVDVPWAQIDQGVRDHLLRELVNALLAMRGFGR